MTVLVDLASQPWAVQTATLNFSVEAGATRIRVTFTRGDWPEGRVMAAELLWGGVPAGLFTTSGGLVRDKQGNPTGGTMQTTYEAAKPPGVTSGTVRVQILQAFTSAILVESL